ncbi:MAG: DUF4349 domain-containing protein [Chloroflexota bacterium]
MKNRAALALLAVSLLLSACALRQQATIVPEMPAPAEAEVLRGAASDLMGVEAPAAGYGGGLVPQAAVERLVIQNASMTVVVPDPAEAVDDISRLAAEMGGFVVSSNVYQSTFGVAQVMAYQASITIRVPAERLNEAMAQIEADATEVRNRNVSSEDVTSQYVDLESQLRNLRAAEEQLREILASATRTEDVMMVFNQLTQVRGEIERIQGQMRYYEESARLASLSVELLPDVVEQPLQIGGWRPEGVAKEALEDLVRALQWLANALIRLGILYLPLLVIFGLPTWLAVRAVVRRRRQRKSPPPEA